MGWLWKPKGENAAGRARALIVQTELFIQEKDPQWKVGHESVRSSSQVFTEDIVFESLLGHDRTIVVSISVCGSPENARDLLEELDSTFGQGLGRGGSREPLEGIGDEGWIWTGFTSDERTTQFTLGQCEVPVNAVVHSRKNNVQFVVSAPSLDAAKRFAALVAEALPPALQAHPPRPEGERRVFSIGCHGDACAVTDRRWDDEKKAHAVTNTDGARTIRVEIHGEHDETLRIGPRETKLSKLETWVLPFQSNYE